MGYDKEKIRRRGERTKRLEGERIAGMKEGRSESLILLKQDLSREKTYRLVNYDYADLTYDR